MSSNRISVEDAIHTMTCSPETFPFLVSRDRASHSQSIDPWNYSLLLAYTESSDQSSQISMDEDTSEIAPSPQGGASGSGSWVPTADARQVGPLQHWTKEEHERFLAALQTCRPSDTEQSGNLSDRTGNVGLGRGVAKEMAKLIGTRTPSQVRSHAQKYFMKNRTSL
eukprot:747616-Hanusia_phi.AAC.1